VVRAQAGFEKANQSLAEMVGAMDGINASSQKISKIIKVIDEIAFQTNILALNAAVEAARAGEAGMGFAVVADEVRNLAQRCAQAAKDTADLIEESIQRSDGGRIKVDQVAVAIREITAESAKIKVLVDEINLGSIEQSSGIDQISRAITQMEQVTQGSAANAEQSAAAAQQLNAQAEHMTDVVEAKRALVDGSDRAPRGGGMRSAVRGASSEAQWSSM
jgi:methyl-accepting chemotaxis protein/methyl-accepting chemotaxis protein-1 (serine sensor receptor)